jgi:hypothetical protein
MKRILPFLSILVLTACSEEPSASLTIREYGGADCENCPKVSIAIVEADGNSALGKSINTAVREEIIELLDFDEENQAADIPGAIEAFTRGFQTMQRDFPEEMTGWEARAEGVKSYEDPALLTIKLDTYVFTGGAHGYGATRYLNFDKATGEEVDGYELLKNPGEFSDYAEKIFRNQYNIPDDAPINSTGFMFEENRFRLPENIGLDAGNIVLHYNPYEAASYADGALILEIPLEQAREFLKTDVP